MELRFNLFYKRLPDIFYSNFPQEAASCSSSEKNHIHYLGRAQAALDEAIVYEAHTARFIDVRLTRVCGLATYLPAYPNYRRDIYHGTEFLDGFYKENVAWNQATSLVE